MILVGQPHKKMEKKRMKSKVDITKEIQDELNERLVIESKDSIVTCYLDIDYMEMVYTVIPHIVDTVSESLIESLEDIPSEIGKNYRMCDERGNWYMPSEIIPIYIKKQIAKWRNG